MECKNGLFLTTDRNCQPCTEPCVSCLSKGVCRSCKMGNYLENHNSSCLSCSPNCLHCLNGSVCLKCAEGYSLDASLLCAEDQSDDVGFTSWVTIFIVI